jgi:hypothetical protein
MNTTIQYSIDAIKEDVRQLVNRGLVSRHQPIYSLCQHIAAREWLCVECELERNDFLLRDLIIDLLGREDWEED